MSRDATLDIGAAAPGAVLPIASAVVSVGAGILLDAAVGWIVAMGVVCLLSGVARVLAGPWISAVILVVVLVATEVDPSRTAVVILAVHLLHVLGSLALSIPLRARFALRALRPTALRFFVVQFAGQAAGLLAVLLPQGRVLPAAVIVGSLAVLAFAFGAVRMLRALRVAGYPVAARSDQRN